MVLSKKRLSLQSGDRPSETDMPQETHVCFIPTCELIYPIYMVWPYSIYPVLAGPEEQEGSYDGDHFKE